MNNKYCIYIIIVLLGACTRPYIPDMKVVHSFDEIETLFKHQNDTTYVINFWATTCPPCIKEMPHFEELGQNNKKKKIKIVMISLDSERRIEPHVRPFLHKLKIKNPVIVMTDQNYTKWTAEINTKWFGALPYTVIYKGDQKEYYFGAFEDFESLEKEVHKML